MTLKEMKAELASAHDDLAKRAGLPFWDDLKPKQRALLFELFLYGATLGSTGAGKLQVKP